MNAAFKLASSVTGLPTGVPSTENVTDPVHWIPGVTVVMVAVKVTGCPAMDGSWDEVTVVMDVKPAPAYTCVE